MAIQKKFSIPVACFVFAILGLGLGVTSRKDGKQSSFVIAIAVIFAYYILMYSGESMAKAHWVSPAFAMWLPNAVLGVAGLVLLVWRARFLELGNVVSIRLPWRRASVDDRAPGHAPPATATAPAGAHTPDAPARAPARGPVVVVLRIPQISLPGPAHPRRAT